MKSSAEDTHLPGPIKADSKLPRVDPGSFDRIAVIEIDPSGYIVNGDAAAVELTGYELSVLVGLEVDRLVPGHLRKRHSNHRESYFRAPHSRSMNFGGRLSLHTRHGVDVPVSISLHAMEDSGNVRCVLERLDKVLDDPVNVKANSLVLRLSQIDNTILLPGETVKTTARDISLIWAGSLVVYWDYTSTSGSCSATHIYVDGRRQSFRVADIEVSTDLFIGRAISTLGSTQISGARDGEFSLKPTQISNRDYVKGIASHVAGRFAPEGVFAVYSRSHSDGLGDREIGFLRQITSALGFLLVRQAVEGALRRELNVQEVLTRLGQVISHTDYLRDRFDEVSAIVGELIGHDRMAVASYNRPDNCTVDVLIAGESIDEAVCASTPIERDSDLENLLLRGDSIIRNFSKPGHARAVSRSEAVRYKAGFQSHVAVPINWQSEVVGILSFRSESNNAYGPDELALARRISDYLAGAIVNYRLIVEIEEQRKVQTFLARIGRVASENLDLKKLYGRLADELHDVVPFDRISFCRWHPEWSTVEFVRGRDASGIEVGTKFETMRFSKSLDYDKSITLNGDLIPFEKILVDIGLRTRIQLRIGTPETPVGLISLARESQLGFTRSEEKLLAQVLDQITPAISTAIAHETILNLAQELSEGEKRYRNLFNSSPDIIVSVDFDTGLIVDNNETVIRKLGYTDKELRNLHIFELYHPDSITTGRYVSAQFRESGKVVNVRATFMRKDSTALDASVSVHAVRDSAGKIVRSIFTVRDITAQLKAESDAQESFRLDSENRELVRLNEARSEFLSRVSHELRTPLTALLAFSDILSKNRGESMSPSQIDQLQLIRKNGWKLEELINDLLDVSRTEIGTYQIERYEFDLNITLQRVVSLAASIFEQNDQHLFIELSDEPIWITGDEKRLSQAISNLLTNASKYTPAGGHIEIRLFMVPSGAQLHIRDNGIGISKANIRNLFTPFFRVDNEQTRRVGGTGLGLVIVKTIVELHGGTIKVDSKLGVGTTVRMILPTISAGHRSGEALATTQ